LLFAHFSRLTVEFADQCEAVFNIIRHKCIRQAYRLVGSLNSATQHTTEREMPPIPAITLQ